MIKIPFNKPALTGRELERIRDALRRGQISGDGYYTQRCSRFLETHFKNARVLLTPSCTHALELAALLLDIRPGDEVIMPTFTFPSTANAFVLRGARPRFVDSRPDTLNMDERLVSEAVGPATRAICPVHYAGVPCEMNAIMQLAKKKRLTVIEDAAQALGASYHGRKAGTFGALNALSFHETKNCICGEGGALVITDPKYIDRAEIIRQKGTNRAQFYRGEVDKYSWVDIGSSYVPSELQAAFLFEQLQHLDTIHRKRKRLFDRYVQSLRPYEARGTLQLPHQPKGVSSSYHLFHLLFNTEKERNRVMEGLQRKGILSVFHYVPLHLSPMGKRLGYRAGQFPVAESASRRLLRLPLYNTLSETEQRAVIRTLEKLL